jgi:small subunit ribosomal protein SAe
MSLLYTNNKDEDIVNMIAAEVHVGTQNCNSQMEAYVYDRTKDGVFYLDLAKTWEKTMVAARIIAAIQEKNPKDVLIVSSRTYAQRAVLKFATHTGANYMGGKWVPGTLTNQFTKRFLEPRLVIVCDPLLDHQALTEASYMNIPIIALCDSDSPLNWVDVAIPANNKSRYSIAYMYWLLAREVLQLRGQIPRDQPWEIMVDLFMFRNPDAKKVDADGDGGMDEEAEPEVEAEDAGVNNAMKTFDGEAGEGDDEEEDEGERWDTPGAAAGATEYAQ